MPGAFFAAQGIQPAAHGARSPYRARRAWRAGRGGDSNSQFEAWSYRSGIYLDRRALTGKRPKKTPGLGQGFYIGLNARDELSFLGFLRAACRLLGNCVEV